MGRQNRALGTFPARAHCKLRTLNARYNHTRLSKVKILVSFDSKLLTESRKMLVDVYAILPSWMTALCAKGLACLSEAMSISCRATNDSRVTVKSSDRT